MKKLILIAASVVTLAACAHTQTSVATNEVILEHRTDYADARNGRNLVIPAPLSDYLISHQFDIPAV